VEEVDNLSESDGSDLSAPRQ